MEIKNYNFAAGGCLTPQNIMLQGGVLPPKKQNLAGGLGQQ